MTNNKLPGWWKSNKPWIIGDCIGVMKGMPDECIDLVVTDPPYGVDYSSKNKFLNEIDGGKRIQEDIIGDTLSKDDTQKLWYNAFKELERIMKKGAVIYCHMPQGGDHMMMMMMMHKAGIEPRHELIWLKNNHVLGRVDYAYIHEPILYAWKGGAGHKFYGGFKRSVLKYDKPLKSKSHPTTKPVKLTIELITNSSKENDIVFDPFLGSGTTLKACRLTDRIGLGCEINPDYEEIIRNRSMDDIEGIDKFLE